MSSNKVTITSSRRDDQDVIHSQEAKALMVYVAWYIRISHCFFETKIIQTTELPSYLQLTMTCLFEHQAQTYLGIQEVGLMLDSSTQLSRG